jgi:hypothetical protein
MTATQPLKRVQVLLSPETYRVLQRLASDEKQSVSALVRRAVEEQLIKEARLAQKADALARLVSMNLPVDDWNVMEAEIMDSRYQGHGN